ncbi:hypothetical protein SRHO_G00076580 [Serrasalmus rhombeus]
MEANDGKVRRPASSVTLRYTESQPQGFTVGCRSRREVKPRSDLQTAVPDGLVEVKLLTCGISDVCVLAAARSVTPQSDGAGFTAFRPHSSRASPSVP